LYAHMNNKTIKKKQKKYDFVSRKNGGPLELR
jgi:hypothetical protein